MKEVIDLMKGMDGSTGFLTYSCKDRRITASHNEGLVLPLASAGKVAIGYAVSGMVESGVMKWDEIIHPIRFNPDEDSREWYQHFQNRQSLMLGEAVEVMIACHDSVVAGQVAALAGGWGHVNRMIRERFDHMSSRLIPAHLKIKGCFRN
jgi:beta-lactamase class A